MTDPNKVEEHNSHYIKPTEELAGVMALVITDWKIITTKHLKKAVFQIQLSNGAYLTLGNSWQLPPWHKIWQQLCRHDLRFFAVRREPRVMLAEAQQQRIPIVVARTPEAYKGKTLWRYEVVGRVG